MTSDTSEAAIQHLQCNRCTSNVTVARKESVAKLVCHCTHVDGVIDPVPVANMAVLPDQWGWA